MAEVAEREWDLSPGPEGEPFQNREGHLVVGWHPRGAKQDPLRLCAEFEAFEEHPLVLRPILMRFATEVECRIYGYEEGTLVPCTSRARSAEPYWQIEWAEQEATDAS